MIANSPLAWEAMIKMEPQVPPLSPVLANRSQLTLATITTTHQIIIKTIQIIIHPIQIQGILAIIKK